jgi:hypothetical protein
LINIYHFIFDTLKASSLKTISIFFLQSVKAGVERVLIQAGAESKVPMHTCVQEIMEKSDVIKD